MTFKYRRSKLDLRKTLYREGPIIIERLPSGKIQAKQTVETADIPDRPQWLVCDCCMSRVDRLWWKKHRAFCFRFRADGEDYQREFFASGWSFCVYCWQLFNAGDIAALTARVVTLNPHLDPDGPGGVRDAYEILAACVWGDVLTWEAGQPRLKLEAE